MIIRQLNLVDIREEREKVEKGLRKPWKHYSLRCVWLFATPRTVTRQSSLSMGFSRQEYWSGLLFPSPGDLPDPGIEPRSPASQAASLPSETAYTSTKYCREESKSKWKSTRRYFKYRGAGQGDEKGEDEIKARGDPEKDRKHRKMLLSTFV